MAQLVQYTKVQVILKAVEVCAPLAAQAPEKLMTAVWRCWHATLPLLRLRTGPMYDLLLLCLVSLHQALWLVGPQAWDDAIAEVFAAVSHQLAVAGSVIHEDGAILLAFSRRERCPPAREHCCVLWESLHIARLEGLGIACE